MRGIYSLLSPGMSGSESIFCGLEGCFSFEQSRLSGGIDVA